MSLVAKVGTTVNYYKSGSVDKDPEAGIVTRCNEEGVADIAVVPRFGGTLIGKPGIRNARDGWHQDHPEISKQNGCWEFIPADEPEVKQEPKPIPDPKGRR